MTSTILTPGDIAIIGYINNGSPDSFSFVNLAAIGSGTVIYFTDNGWTGSGFRGVSGTDADGNENVIKFTANVDIPAGTVIRSIDTSSLNFTWAKSGLVAPPASGSYADLSFAQGTGTSGGDQIIAVQSTGTSPLLSDFTAISQIDYTGAFEDATSSNTGNVAPGLSQASNTAVLFNNSATYAAFNLNTLSSGTKTEWLAAINNATNWTFGSATSLPTGSITVSGGAGSQPDLTINQTDSPDPVIVGNPLTYTLTVSNSGTANANAISVEYTLPSGVTFNGTSVANGFTASVSGGIVTFSGGSINAGSNATLTVNVTPNSPGTLTSGTATVDSNNTIAESNETNNTAAAIATTVNNVVVGEAPTIQLDTASTTDLLDANGALSTTGTGAISGVIGNANDPANTLGVNFIIADSDTPVANLTVTVTSSNTAVVPNGNLTLTGTGNSRNLKINPVGVGTANITVAVSDGNSTANYAIAYAASANNGTATTQFLTGTSDASTAIPVGGTFFLEADDENQVLRLYDSSKSGLPVTGFDFTSSLGLTDANGSGGLREVDLEASTKVGDRIFWLGSQSNSDDGKSRPNRDRVFATDISGAGASTTLSYVGRYDFLREDIINWDVTNGHGKGANYYGLAASAATNVGSKQANGYNIEGLEIAPDSTTAYIAFRAPQVPPSGRANALIVPVTNFANLISASAGGTQGSAQFGAPIELDLGDRGIREIRKNANNQYVIIAGPAGDAGAAPNDFRLYTWDGNPNSQPQLRTAAFPASFNPEGIISIPDNLTNTSQIQFISDDGNSVLYNDGTSAKDLSENNFKKFRTDSIPLGGVVFTPRIHDIQGASHISALNGQNVSDVPGIVTVIKSNGFYLQDPNPDSDDRTSEGIFIFTSSAPTVQVGDSVLVGGTVSEFRPGGASGANNLTTTEITSPTIVKLSSGNALPTATILGNGGRAIPNTVIENDASNVETNGIFDPAQDGIDFYESLEAMRVQVNNPVAVSPTNSFGEIWVLADNGINATGRTARGGIVISPNDFNPERIQIDDTLFTSGSSPQVNVGATFDTITGVVDYSFSNYEVLPTSVTVTSNTLTKEVTNLTPTTNQLTVATFNVENLDIGDGATKFSNLASRIVNNLKSPDIISLEEIQDNNGPTNDSVVDASVTFQTLINAIATAGGPTYQYRQINPVDDTNGGEPGGNIRVGFLFNPNRVSFVDTPGGTSTSSTTVTNVSGVPSVSASPGLIDPTNSAFNTSRKPLVGQFTFNGKTVYVIGNHFNSKGGDQPLFGPNQPPTLSSEVQRQQQATLVKNFVQSILAIDPNANIVVAGDLNDFEFSNPVSTLESAGLTSLIETLPPNERYTYNFEGNAQTLDHILVSNSLLNKLDAYDVVHINSEFADQDSDHEPSLARFNLPGNNAPTDIALSATSVNENVPANTVVGTFTTTDPDTGNTFTYSLVAGTGDADNAAFAIANNSLQINGSPDFETKSSYSIRVRSSDNGGLFVEKVLTIQISDRNEAPTLNSAIVDKTTAENSAFNFTFAANTFADVDAGDTLTYTASLADGNILPSWLVFNPNTRTFSGTPAATNVGIISIKVTAKDTSNANISDIFDLTVTPLNLTGTPNADILTGTASNNTISGLAGNDTITGNKGNDTITGGSGQDKFVYNLGDGTDTITDFGGVGKGVNPTAAVIAATDTLKFQGAGLTAQNLLLTKNGNNLEVSFESVANNPKVILQNFPLENLDNLQKSDGASVNLGNILFNGQTTIQESFDVFDANSTLTTVMKENTVTFLNDLNNNVNGLNNSADVINGQLGNDQIDGKSGSDLLRGGAGNDTLIGGAGNDTLIGGADNDVLTGNGGNNQFVYQAFSDRGTTGDAIADFNKNQDQLVLTVLLQSLGYSGSNAIADGYLKFVQSGTSTRVQVDSNGGADAFNTLATLNNFTATNLVIGNNVLV